MSTSMEENDYRTIGLPRGAAQEAIKNLKSQKRKEQPLAAMEPPIARPAPEVDKPGARVPIKPPEANGSQTPSRAVSPDPEPDRFRTIPPPGSGRPLKVPSLNSEAASELVVPRGQTRPLEAGRSRDEAVAPSGRLAGGSPAKPNQPRRDSQPLARADNWPDGSDLRTGPLPGQFAASKPEAFQESAAADSGAVPADPWSGDAFPCIVPEAPQPIRAKSSPRPEHTNPDTPPRFPGSNDQIPVPQRGRPALVPGIEPDSVPNLERRSAGRALPSWFGSPSSNSMIPRSANGSIWERSDGKARFSAARRLRTGTQTPRGSPPST